MNAKQFMYLMNTLPDDMIESAVRFKRRRTNKLFVLLPPVAACFAVAMTAVIYPKLKVSPPEMRENDLTTSATTQTASAETVTVLSSDTSVTNLFFSDAATTHSTAKTTETGTAVSTDSYVTSLISSAAATTGYTAEMTGNVTVLSTVMEPVALTSMPSSTFPWIMMSPLKSIFPVDRLTSPVISKTGRILIRPFVSVILPVTVAT